MNDALTSLGRIVGGSVLLVVLAITAAVCVADARRRGKSPVLVVLAVMFFFPLGMIAWLLFRPAPLDSARPGKEFRLEDYRVQ